MPDQITLQGIEDLLRERDQLVNDIALLRHEIEKLGKTKKQLIELHKKAQLAAYSKFRVAERRGDLTRPEQCEICGTETNVQAHHDDYGQPLDVRWLCMPCHTIRHRELQVEAKVTQIKESAGVYNLA